MDDFKRYRVEKSDEICSICWEDRTGDMVERRCGHIFHDACHAEWLSRQRWCPYCRDGIGDDSTPQIQSYNFIEDEEEEEYEDEVDDDIEELLTLPLRDIPQFVFGNPRSRHLYLTMPYYSAIENDVSSMRHVKHIGILILDFSINIALNFTPACVKLFNFAK